MKNIFFFEGFFLTLFQIKSTINFKKYRNLTKTYELDTLDKFGFNKKQKSFLFIIIIINKNIWVNSPIKN
jgi:hypothetical protein